MTARLLALVGIVLVTAGCGASEVPRDIGVAEVGTARVEWTTLLDDGSGATESRRTGTVDYARHRSDVVEHTKEGTTRTITIDDAVYVETGFESEPYGRKSWLRTESVDEAEFEQSVVAEQGDVPPLPLGRLLVSGPPGPEVARYLDYLREVGGEPERLGSDVVRGVSTMRYGDTLDLQRVMSVELELRGWKAGNIQRYIEPLERMKASVEAWIDAEGLTRRVVTRITAESLGFRGGDISNVTTTEFYGFGVSVDIQPPPPDQVVDARDVEFTYYVDSGAVEPFHVAPDPTALP